MELPLGVWLVSLACYGTPVLMVAGYLVDRAVRRRRIRQALDLARTPNPIDGGR